MELPYHFKNINRRTTSNNRTTQLYDLSYHIERFSVQQSDSYENSSRFDQLIKGRTISLKFGSLRNLEIYDFWTTFI